MAIKKLSILFMKGGFSFCVLKGDEVVHLQKVNYDESYDSILAQLHKQFNHNLYLNQTYENIAISYLGSQFNLIPTPYYSEDPDAQKWLKFSSEVYEDDIIKSDDLDIIDAKIVYAYHKVYANFIKEKYAIDTINHASKIFINQISPTEEPSLFINVHLDQVEILVYKNQKLQLYNIFDISTKEDLVYYVLNCIQILNLDSNSIKLYYFGWKIDNSSLKMLMNFVRHVMPGSSNLVELEFFTEIRQIQ